MFEVEQKFRVPDHTAIESHLLALGAISHGTIEQADTYYAHPARDFARTDEALRIRRVGAECHITYKGPKLDQTTKTRREIELPLGNDPSTSIDWDEILIALDFKPVATVVKTRHRYELHRTPWQIEIALDEIAQLGHFVELEIVADEEQLPAAKAALATLAAELDLRDSERCSYLELLLKADAFEK